MKSFVPFAVAIASVLMIQPASAQQVHRAAHPHIGHGYAGRGPARYQHGGYARGYAPGYGVGVGAAALATGALVGGAIATQNQGYYPDQTYPGYAQTYPGYSDPGYVYSNAAPAAYSNGDSVAYCEQTYRSYDPASGSYLGYDGIRHPCP